MDPRTIVAVLDPAAAGSDAVLVKGVSLARWYGADLHTIGAEGHSVRAIAEYATRVSADLVVVGKDARRSRGYWASGGFASAVGRAVKVPTIAVRDDGSQIADASAACQHILAAVDFSAASRRALSEALGLARRAGGRLRLLHVLDGFPYESVYSGSRAFRLMDDLRARTARADAKLRSLIPDALDGIEVEVGTVAGDAAGAIMSAAARQPTDLIVLGLPRRSRLSEMVGGSTAQKVLRRAASPVLLVPGPPTIRLVERPAPSIFEVRQAIRSGWTLDRIM